MLWRMASRVHSKGSQITGVQKAFAESAADVNKGHKHVNQTSRQIATCDLGHRPWATSHHVHVGAAYLSVHVGTVHVHLTAVVVDDLADCVHILLVHTVCGGVGDHEGCQAAA